MKSRDYWKKRAEHITSYEFDKADNYKLKLEEEYKKTLRGIQDDIESFCSKFAENNKISISEAKRLLNSNELHEFKMDLKEFARKAKDNKNLQWEKELNNLSNKVRVTRLEALQSQVRNELENLYIKQQESTTKLLGDVYKDTYYRNIYEIHKGLGLAINFAKLDTNTINRVITEPWHGENYSSRIWNNKELLVKELQSNLTQAFIRGDSIDKTSKIIANRMGVATGRARTLVNTESANIISKATLSSYSSSGIVKKYEILATLDLHTSKICRALDGKVFDLSEKQIGINVPPFHPNCRTTIIPYFDDAIDEERIARDSDGSNYPVKGNMTYEDWYDKYVTKKTEKEYNNLIGLSIGNDKEITGISYHIIDRAIERKVSAESAKEALLNPLKIGKIKKRENGNSKEYIGEDARVIVNPDTGNIITVWRTSSKLRKKLKGAK